MKFSLTTAALISLLQITSALPTDSQADSIAPVDIISSDIEDFGSDAENSTSIEERRRGLFTTYPCTQAYRLKLYKSSKCDVNPTRTDIENWPLPGKTVYDYAGKGKCIDVTSKSEMYGMTFTSDTLSMHVDIYSDKGCNKKSEVIKGDLEDPGLGACHNLWKPRAILDKYPIKSFRVYGGDKDKECRSSYKNGVPGGGQY